ncbi:PD-(D/E)XK nuclease family protein [Nocardia sp. IBHARD005]|uniref:PD-(D/E)XK nuclease family protein n=1 Tax=Nocardia sp. IBHARD005 TaxID=3457765 RepID=UPI0040594262
MTDYSIKRDFYGRPWVSQDCGPLRYEDGRKTPVNAVGYTRVSTLAETLDDKSNLTAWQCANATIGVVRDPSLYAQIAALASAHRDPWNVPEAKRELKPLVERAQQMAGASEAAGLGTSFHSFAEQIDAGKTPEFVPPPLIPWLDRYSEAMAPWEVIDAEGFVVSDEVQSAGSYDRLLRHRGTGRVVIADIKSGKADPDYPLKVTIQTAIYAHSERYDQETGARSPLHVDIDLAHGVLIHVPIRTGKPRATLYPLDLARGWELAKTALAVREARRMPKLEAFA